jgi:thiopeptide-type bacteriocin biosynthesis protein
MSWLSFHLFLEDGFDDFLVSALPPFLAAESKRGSFCRFFFIRYSEGGDHLRLRFLAPQGQGLEERLGRCAAAAAGAGFRLEPVPYNRTQHYFGETRASVYAELLNETTSRLALRLLAACAGQPRLRRWLVLAATHDIVIENLTAGKAHRQAWLVESRGFARRAAEEIGGPEARPALDEGERMADRWSAPIEAVRARLLPQLGSDRDIRRLTALLRRARGLPSGSSVGIHGLHLLHNKLGFSFIEEHAAYAALIQDRRTR